MGDAHSLSYPGVWRKPNRTIRMKEKRADFVAGCLGGRVVAVGGLGNAGDGQACGQVPIPILCDTSVICMAVGRLAVQSWGLLQHCLQQFLRVLTTAGETLLPCPTG